jgi:hypothetical protein
MTEQCHSCKQNFADFRELAVHIMSTKKGHKKGRTWAAKFLAGNTLRIELKRAPVDPDHENTEYGDENRRNAVRELSGENEYANTICPHCKRVGRSLIEVEHINSEFAVKVNGRYFISCQSCTKEN